MDNDRINTSGRDWLIVEAYAEKRLTEYRQRNDSVALTDTTTNYLRGRIAELKDLLALGRPTPINPDGTPGIAGDGA